jgi:hypothetical protein
VKLRKNVTAQRATTAATFFCLTRDAWTPYALTWDAESGEFRGVEGPRGFATYREAVEASRFLVMTLVHDCYRG